MHSSHYAHRLPAARAVLLAAALTVGVILPIPGGVSAANSHPDRIVDVTKAPYDATGDSTTNDRAAIQSAIDEVAASGGGTVVLPAGRTFLSGNLTLQNDVTLRIDGSLRQSQNPDDYTYTPLLGRTVAGGCTEGCGSGHDWFNTWFRNYPLIYAGQKHDIGVTGTGTIFMTQAPSGQAATIEVIAIGFFQVDNFTISGLEILNNNCYNVTAWQSTHGLISNLGIDSVSQPNTDGINVKDSQHIRITGNTIDNTDDGIIVGSGYNDPRAGTWWLSNSTRGGSQDIEIDHNVDRLHASGGKSIAFIPWGTTAPDARWTELKNINIHDNFLQSQDGIGCWCDNPYDTVTSNTDHSAIKQVRITNNRYLYYNAISPAHLETIQNARITDLVDDFGKPSYSTVLNPGFEQTGTAYWSTDGDAGAAQTTSPTTGPHSAAARNTAATFASGDWYGYLEGSAETTSLYQGLGLEDAVRYRLQAKVVNSDRPILLFAQNTCTGQTVAQKTVSTTTPQTVTLDFAAPGTCGDYHIGFALAGYGAHGWALVDDAALSFKDIVIDDTHPGFSYSGSWSAVTINGPLGDTYHWGLAAGSTATVSFTGSRAFLYGLLHWNNGRADVYLDGAYEGTIDTYNNALADHRILFDTGAIGDGTHTLAVVATGTHNPSSSGDRLQIDALVVQAPA